MPPFQRQILSTRTVVAILFVASTALGWSAESSWAADRVEVSAQIVASNGGQQAELQITARVQPGWHIYSITQKPGGPKPTRINLVASDRYRLLGKFVAVPPATVHHYDFWPDLDVEEHEHTVFAAWPGLGWTINSVHTRIDRTKTPRMNLRLKSGACHRSTPTRLSLQPFSWPPFFVSVSEFICRVFRYSNG